jgi:hypothetical protein
MHPILHLPKNGTRFVETGNFLLGETDIFLWRVSLANGSAGSAELNSRVSHLMACLTAV